MKTKNQKKTEKSNSKHKHKRCSLTILNMD